MNVFFSGNESPQGNNCASDVQKLAFPVGGAPPKSVFPGQEFPIEATLLDGFDNVVLRLDVSVVANTNSTSISNFISGVVRDTQPLPDYRGFYSFPHAYFTSSSSSSSANQKYSIEFEANSNQQNSGSNSNLFPLQSVVNISVVSCPPNYIAIAGTCVQCTNGYSLVGNAASCLACPTSSNHHETTESTSSNCVSSDISARDSILESCVVVQSSSSSSSSAPGEMRECIAEACEKLNLPAQVCSSVVEGNSFILNIQAGFWPVPSSAGFINPTELIGCETCQPFFCTMTFDDDNYAQWAVNCSFCAVSNEEQGEGGEGEENGCMFNNVDCRCCEGYTNRGCSQCITPGYYSHGEKCVACSDEWYSQFWMSIISFILVVGLIIVAVWVRKNLLALCLELIIVVALFLLGIGSGWVLIVMLMVLTVLFFTNSDIQDGVLKCLIFFVETCSLVTANLFDWGSIYGQETFLITHRNGLECMIPWYNKVVGFWLFMTFPIGIAVMCVVVYFVGKIIISWRQAHPDQHQQKQQQQNAQDEEEHDGIDGQKDSDSDAEENFYFMDQFIGQFSSIDDEEEEKRKRKERDSNVSQDWVYRCISICLFLWYIIYYEIAASVCNLLLQ